MISIAIGHADNADLNQQQAHPFLQSGQQHRFKPGIALEPGLIPRAGVRQGQIARPDPLPTLHRLGHAALELGQVIRQGTLAQHHRQLDIGQGFKQRPSPLLGALSPWRCIPAAAFAWVAKTHRHNGKMPGVAEGLPIHPQPGPQPVATGVIERQATFMRLSPRCLASNQYGGSRVNLEDGFWMQRQLLATDLADVNAL